MSTEKAARAGMGQVFICRVCAHAYADRAATAPMRVQMRRCVAQVAQVTPHPRYPDDAELATTTWVDVAGQDVDIPERAAGVCCPDHTVLCSANHIRFRRMPDNSVEIIGAEHLE